MATKDLLKLGRQRLLELARNLDADSQKTQNTRAEFESLGTIYHQNIYGFGPSARELDRIRKRIVAGGE